MKKTLLTGLYVVLAATLLWSAGQQAESTQVSGDWDGYFPLESQMEMSILVHNRPDTDDYKNNVFTRWLEEKTNVDFSFVSSPENEAQKKLNLLFAAGDYPEMVVSLHLTTQQQALYGSQGFLIPLNDLIDRYGNNTKKVFEEFPLAKELFTMGDGNIYNLPRINECFHCMSSQKMWIYKPWLDTLGLEVPKTTEEFYQTLKKFKTEDPNGNGLSDEIPFAGATSGWEATPEAFLMNAFIYNADDMSGTKSLYIDNGTVKASYFNDAWKDGLKYMQKLAKEGLFAQESFIQDANGLIQMGEYPDTVILGSFPGGFTGIATNLAGDRWDDYVSVPPLEGPKGVRTVKYDPFRTYGPGASITDTCKNPEVAMGILDLIYDQEVTLNLIYGVKDENWAWAEEGDIGINGKPAVWVFLQQSEPNTGWNGIGNTYRPAHFRLGQKVVDPNSNEVKLYKETKANYEPFYPPVESVMPKLAYTAEQSEQILTYSTAINSYVDEMTAYFILSDVDIDTEWSEYKNELQAMGLEEMLAVYQQAYEEQHLQ